MQDLIKIEEKNGKQLVSARLLHEFLELSEKFTDWIDRTLNKYGFFENVDYIIISEKSEIALRPLKQFYLTLDCAKQLAMVANNDKGKQARLYFIECEKKLKEVQPKQLSRLEILEIAIENEKKVIALEAQLEAQKDDVAFAQQLKDTTNSLDFATAAKAMKLGYGRNGLFQKCRELNILDKRNLPYQEFIDRNYFVVLETSFIHPKSGDRVLTTKTMLTAKGQSWLLKQLSQIKN